MTMHYKMLAQHQSVTPVQFANIGDTARRGKHVNDYLAKTEAIMAAAALPAADPVPTVGYKSRGNTLIIGSAEQVLPWAEHLAAQLSVTVLLTDGSVDHPLPGERRFPVFSGHAVEVRGWLGTFNVAWQQTNPINTEQRHAKFDLIFDLSPTPLITLHQPPPGYFTAGVDKAAQMMAALQLTEMVGDFEKPKYFSYKERLCAHSRNQKVGCNACIDVCSAGAIDSAGDRIKVNPHLCAGCGACTTVCPSGALAYGYPTAPHMGKRLKTMLTAYAKAGGSRPALLLHNDKQGRALVTQLGRLEEAPQWHQGLPARLMQMEVHNTACVGIDLWLATVAYGATGVAVLVTDEEPPQYIDALTEQMVIAQTVLTGLGYAGPHLQLIQATTPDELDAALSHLPHGQTPEKPATFDVATDKRNALDFVLDHLYRHAPVQQEHIALPVGAPFGAVDVDTAACTLCMSCVGACPASALMDSKNTPQLRFVEKNCVQCGLCTQTCPEDAITLVPRLSFADTAKKSVVLNEATPFCCIRCNKPFGTLQMIESMMAKLAHHSAFSGNLDRIKMCGDCRVVDMMEHKQEASIVEGKRR